MKKKGRFNFVLGFILGAALFGSATAFAAGITALPSANRIIVDGKEAGVTAYSIDGRNYLQLRDMAAAVDFSVVWDGENNQVLIDTTRRYDPNETFPAESATPADEIAEPAVTIDELKAEFIRLTNIERVKAGLPELEILPELMDCAQAKADDMRDNHYYGHNSPVYGTATQMIKNAVPSARIAAENIASWTKTAQEVVSGLMDSEGHRSNILHPKLTHIGVGIVKGADGGYWWVQQFISLA